MPGVSRLLLCALLAVTACASPDGEPSPSPATPSPTPLAVDDQGIPRKASGTHRCGDFTVAWEEGRLTVTAGDRTVLREEADGAAAVTPHRCEQLADSPAPDLVYTVFSGAAHCCTTLHVVPLDRPDAHLLREDLGNAGLQGVEQLDDFGAVEIVAGSGVFAYFDELPFAASPILPRVYSFEGAGYVEATRRFPDFLRGRLREVEGRKPDGELESRTAALHWFGLRWLLGTDEKALQEAGDRFGQSTVEWLREHADEARTLLEKTYA